MRAAVDCHMVGQPEAGDAGNARFHALLTRALAATARNGDEVLALVAHAAAGPILDGAARLVDVPAGNVARLGWGAASVLAREQARAGIFSYVTPLRAPCPLLVVVHDMTFRLHPGWFSPRVRALLGAMVPRSVRRAARVITVSEDVEGRPRRDARHRPRTHQRGLERALTRLRARGRTPRPGCGGGSRSTATACTSATSIPARTWRPSRRASPCSAIPISSSPWWAAPATAARRSSRGVGRAVARTARRRRSRRPVHGGCGHVLPVAVRGIRLPVVVAMACGCPVVASNRGAIPEVAGDAGSWWSPPRRRSPRAFARRWSRRWRTTFAPRACGARRRSRSVAWAGRRGMRSVGG